MSAESDYADAVSRILLRQGQARAQGALGSGQAWGNFANSLGPIMSRALEQHQQGQAFEKEQQLRDQQIAGNKALEEERRQSTLTQQQEEAEKVRKRNEAQRIHDAADQAYAQIKDGNADEVFGKLAPEPRALAEGWYQSFEKAKQDRALQGQADGKRAAQLIQALDYDPVVAATSIRLLGELYPSAKDVLDHVTDPKKLKTIVDHFATMGEKPPEPYTLAEGGQRRDPRTNAILAENPKDVTPTAAPHAGTFEDYVTRIAAERGKTPAMLSPLDIRQAKAAYEAAGRAPEKPADNLPRMDRSYQQANTALESIRKPIADQVERFGRLAETVNQSTPQADALVAPELLTVMAGGAGSGLRMNEAEISRIIGGRSKFEDLKAAVNKWQLDPTKALSVTPAQRQQIRDLMNAVKTRTDAKLAIVNKASQELIDAPDVDSHRRIISDARQKIDAVGSAEPSETVEEWVRDPRTGRLVKKGAR